MIMMMNSANNDIYIDINVNDDANNSNKNND